jgi:hypothetical protein
MYLVIMLTGLHVSHFSVLINDLSHARILYMNYAPPIIKRGIKKVVLRLLRISKQAKGQKYVYKMSHRILTHRHTSYVPVRMLFSTGTHAGRIHLNIIGILAAQEVSKDDDVWEQEGGEGRC